MTPPHRIDIDAALGAAVRRFWRHGYAATSIADLEAATGLPRQSIYSRFGSKRGLFLRALDHYEAGMQAEVLAPVLDMASPRAAVTELFRVAAAMTAADGIRDGCLTINTALEVAPHDAEVRARIARSLEGLEGLLRDLVRRSVAAGETDPAVAPEAAARALLGLFLGLRVLTRSHPEPALLASVVGQVGALLPPAGPSADRAAGNGPGTEKGA